MRNIFLTGEVGIGKSTVVQKTLALLSCVSCGGFLTVSAAPITEGAMLDVFIERTWERTPHDAEHLVGSRWDDGHFTAYPSAFDIVGTSILEACSADAKLIIMDELGLMESDATKFQKAVIGALNGPLPVLGVIKPKHSAFLDAIRSHEKSEIFELTRNNRDELPYIIANLLLV